MQVHYQIPLFKYCSTQINVVGRKSKCIGHSLTRPANFRKQIVGSFEIEVFSQVKRHICSGCIPSSLTRLLNSRRKLNSRMPTDKKEYFNERWLLFGTSYIPFPRLFQTPEKKNSRERWRILGTSGQTQIPIPTPTSKSRSAGQSIIRALDDTIIIRHRLCIVLLHCGHAIGNVCKATRKVARFPSPSPRKD